MRSQATSGRQALVSSLLASGAALGVNSFADGKIIPVSVGKHFGWAAGDSTASYELSNLPMPAGDGRNINFTSSGGHRNILVTGTDFQIRAAQFGPASSQIALAQRLDHGKTINAAPGSNTSHAWVAKATSNAALGPLEFSNKYLAFTFQDANTGNTDYGWLEASLSGSYSNLDFNLISYAYDDSGAVIAMGDTESSAVPEPSSLVACALGAMVLGSRGMRRFKTALSK